ncbi:hypothetical protein HCCG_00794 [Helicobacter cinaedi CCUG 18818 = ATCC BAA-847]|uniref:Uncharacterized protein n=1 Tax=Helicobacter cinaedi CCUG 18818 = ATCC BAA-847 TaxID=537971 RepID=A0ABN0BBW9_9HELI|nr:hypothetical protein HCCG_00794 [Helicobacter cinaedi CCUG 18818 = ATCC BAA-847]
MPPDFAFDLTFLAIALLNHKIFSKDFCLLFHLDSTIHKIFKPQQIFNDIIHKHLLRT